MSGVDCSALAIYFLTLHLVLVGPASFMPTLTPFQFFCRSASEIAHLYPCLSAAVQCCAGCDFAALCPLPAPPPPRLSASAQALSWQEIVFLTVAGLRGSLSLILVQTIVTLTTESETDADIVRVLLAVQCTGYVQSTCILHAARCRLIF